jgi:hypothetical protein
MLGCMGVIASITWCSNYNCRIYFTGIHSLIVNLSLCCDKWVLAYACFLLDYIISIKQKTERCFIRAQLLAYHLLFYGVVGASCLQLAGRYLESIEPEQVQVRTPPPESLGAKVMVFPLSRASAVLPVAVIVPPVWTTDAT